MNERGRITIRIIAGGYLVYLGIDLIRNVITGKPDNALIFGAVGVLFLMVGAVVCVKSIRDYRNCQKAEYEDTEEDESEVAVGIEDDTKDDVEEKAEGEE